MYLTTVAHLNIIIQEKESFMYLWQLYIVVGLACIIFEMLVPSMFFLNLAIAAFFSAAAAYIGLATIWQVLIFGIFAGILLGFLRPILIKNVQKEDTTTGLDEKYLGQKAKTIRPTGENDGRVTIYGEECVARSVDGSEIPEGIDVKIVRNEGTIFFVEKI